MSKPNFTFNPFYIPGSISILQTIFPEFQTDDSRVQRTATSSLTQAFNKTYTPSASVNRQVDALKKSSSAASVLARKIATQSENFKSFRQTFQNNLHKPKIPNDVLVDTLKKQIGKDLYHLVCEEVSLALKGNKSAELGDQLLNQNIRCLLCVRDAEGKTPLSQIQDYFCELLETQRAISALYHLKAQLIRHSEYTKWVQNFPADQIVKEHSKKQAEIIKDFESLPLKAKSFLCWKMWSLDQSPPHMPNYGYHAILQDINKLLEYKEASPLEECIATCHSQYECKLQLSFSKIYPHEIQITDSIETFQDIEKFYLLENFHSSLKNPSKDNTTLLAQFHHLPKELKDIFYTLVWVANLKPDQLEYGKYFIETNVRALLGLQNQNGQNIISQLISHYDGKIQIHRLETEIFQFISEAGKLTTQPAAVLALYNALSPKAQDDLRYRVWYHDGGHSDPHFGGWGYGENKIRTQPIHLFEGRPSIAWKYLRDLREKWETADKTLIENFECTCALPSNPIDVSTSPLEKREGLIDHLPHHLRIAFVTAELAGVVSSGGLASALDGMVRGFGAEDSRVIIPLYRGGPIKDEVIAQMKETDHNIRVEGREIKIWKTKIRGVRCYFVDDPSVLTIQKKPDGSVGNFYGDSSTEYDLQRHRWSVFQKAAADLSYAFSKKEHPIELVHVHDAQTALVPKILQKSHPEEWSEGRTPATVFTFHNTAEPMFYPDDRAYRLSSIGLPHQQVNSFIEALNDAEMVTTVSRTYGLETQMASPRVFANGMHDSIHKAAFKGKLYGIVNGNTNDWNPMKSQPLEKWRSVLPGQEGTCDLRFGPQMSDEQLASNLKRCQQELCAYLKQLDPTDPEAYEAYADLDPEKPINMYVGRYDFGQKGIDKLMVAMRETLALGGQFICVGTEPDPASQYVLDQLKRIAREEYENKGVLILIDKKKNGSLVHQSKFGPLLRAASILGNFYSAYEPCGLVQGEFNRYGKKVIATRTGGFPDTLMTEGPGANSFLVDRMENWESEEQNNAIRQTLRIAFHEAHQLQNALYHGTPEEIAPFMQQMRTIMTNALNSTWEKTPDGSLSAIRRMELVYAEAFRQRENRGIIPTHLTVCKP